MSIDLDIEELREVSRELEKSIRLKILRRILKMLLVGFFIGRDIDRRVSETASRRDLIVRHIREYFDDVERLLKQLEETRRVDAFTARMSEKEQIAGLLSLGDDLRFLVTKPKRTPKPSMTAKKSIRMTAILVSK